MKNNKTGDGEQEVTEVEKKKPISKKRTSTNKDIVLNNMDDDIYTNVVKADTETGKLTENPMISAGNDSTNSAYLTSVDSVVGADIEKELTTDELVTVGINYTARDKSNKKDIKYPLINKEEFYNHIEYGKERVGIKSVNVNATGALSGSSAVAKFVSKLGIGKHTCVVLWHSGFSLVLAPPKESEIISLEYNIAKIEQKLGMETNNFIYSNYGVIINKMLVEFIIDHVVGSSLILPEGHSYIDYIKVTDLETLAIGQATSMRPNGYPLTVTCKNSLIFKDGHPVCDFTATADVVPNNLLWVKRNILTPETLAHISKTSPGSHTVESVINYQNSLAVNSGDQINIKTANNEDITFNICTPTLRKYIDTGELWVNSIIASTEKLLTESDSDDLRREKVNAMVSASILNKYNSYITAILLDDATVEDSGAIGSILEVMSSDGALSNTLLEKIISHIDSNYISLVATYNFDCPKCAKAGRDSQQASGHIKGFKEFIPLNAVEHFLDLTALTFTQVVNREN